MGGCRKRVGGQMRSVGRRGRSPSQCLRFGKPWSDRKQCCKGYLRQGNAYRCKPLDQCCAPPSMYACFNHYILFLLQSHFTLQISEIRVLLVHTHFHVSQSSDALKDVKVRRSNVTGDSILYRLKNRPWIISQRDITKVPRATFNYSFA